MDLSVIAASIGSFVVSERVIRAKASVMAVLASVAVYDLCRHSHDPASLRVYRGPAMVAFTMSCVAASLRIWRRSGVACDELLFLPGTPYAAKHGVRCPAVDAEIKRSTSSGTGGQTEQQLHVSGVHGMAGQSGGADAQAGRGHDNNDGDDDDAGVELTLQNDAHAVHGDADPDAESDADAASTDILSVSTSSGGPVIVPLHFDSGPDAAAGTPIASQQQQQEQGGGQEGRPPRPSPRQQKRRMMRRTLSDTDLLDTVESDEAAGGGGGGGGGGDGGMRSRRNTDEQAFGSHPQQNQSQAAAEGTKTEGPDSDASGLHAAPPETFSDEDMGLLEEGKRHHHEDDDSDGDDAAGDDDDDRGENQRESLLDRNKGLKDESMLRYLLCSHTERLRRRTGRRSDAAQAEGSSASSSAKGGGGSSSVARSSAPTSPSSAGGTGERSPPSSKKTDEINLTYSPSGPSVAGAAVDLCLPVLFNFHMFVVLSNSRSGSSSSPQSDSSPGASSSSSVAPSTDPADEMDPRILPLIFLSALFLRSVLPFKSRARFWSTVKYTAFAPLYSVYFRDAFMGDVMTSLVKPIMDLAYCIFYYFISVYMILSASHTLDQAGEILEKSWALHNVVLPAIAILPLWWKFLQTLRQAWDDNKRWPHLGNSFKYLTATMVVLYGMAHREGMRSWWWVTSFALATLYQIWWDTFMDWELLVIVPKRRGDGTDTFQPQPPAMDETSRRCGCAENCSCNCISSIPASSYMLLPLHRHVVQPVTDLWRRISLYLSTHTVTLRPRRLYRREQFYRRVFLYNALSRFVWMLSFIPAYHLSRDGREIQTFTIDAKTYVGAALSVAEIVRRCLWGILKLELETVKVTDYAPVPTEEDGSPDVSLATADERFGGKSQQQSGVDMVLSALQFESQSLMVQSATGGKTTSEGGSGGGGRKHRFEFSDAFWRRCFLAELILWVAAFVGFGFVSVWVL